MTTYDVMMEPFFRLIGIIGWSLVLFYSLICGLMAFDMRITNNYRCYKAKKYKKNIQFFEFPSNRWLRWADISLFILLLVSFPLACMYAFVYVTSSSPKGLWDNFHSIMTGFAFFFILYPYLLNFIYATDERLKKTNK